MKKLYPYSFLLLVGLILLSVTLSAQETKVTIKVEKDGEIVKDTTYTYDDADQADHAIKIVEVLSGGDEHLMKIHKKMGEVHGDHMVVMKSGDCETLDILMDEDCVHAKKIKVMVSDGEEGEWEILADDGEEIDIETIIKEHGEGDGEEVKVIVVKKKVHKGELHEEHEHDHDEDHDVEVEVEKKVKKKKSKKQ